MRPAQPALPPPEVEVLIPTYRRPQALAVTLAGLASQDHGSFGVRVSDQTERPVIADPVVASMTRVLRHRGVPVRFEHHLPRRGLAEQRDHLLRGAESARVLFLDDDVWLEPWAISRLCEAMTACGCGFVGFAVQGLSYAEDRRPHERTSYEEWSGSVVPERVRRGDPAWERHRLHNAANPTHLAEEIGLRPGEWRAYKVAWIGACVLYDRRALSEVGGFSFWPRVPADHAGEDVVAQLRVMERYGGAGILPSGAVHLELPTTVPVRDVECYDAVGL